MKASSVDILLVEDNPGDIRLMYESLKDCKINNTMDVVQTGEDAIKFLLRNPPYENKKTPAVVFLDLNLPGIKGMEVLKFIKNNEDLKHIPVVILTASAAEADVVKSYNLHANCYVCKPLDFDEFLSVVRSVTDFWFSIVKLPPESGGN